MLRLEPFETEKPTESSGQTIVIDQMALEETKLEAYDRGYQAGWDDAAHAQSNDRAAISAELARNLQAMTFTYQEARAHVLRALRPFMSGLAERVLPAIAHETLGAVIAEVITPRAERAANQPIKLVLHPSRRELVAEYLAKTTGLPLEIEEEPSLGEGQVFLMLGKQETAVDLDGAVAAIQSAVRGFLDQSQNENQAERAEHE
jgi:flagellar biosynthesis/type III secretory pathway protein FliH